MRKVALMSTTHPVSTSGSTSPIIVLNTHTDPAFPDPALLVQRTIASKDCSKGKKEETDEFSNVQERPKILENR